MAVHLLPALFICLCCLFAVGGRRGISGGGPEGKRDCEQRIQMANTAHTQRSLFARENPAKTKRNMFICDIALSRSRDAAETQIQFYSKGEIQCR